jgi:hypothetical protein
VLWLRGCRPSLTVRLLYNFSGKVLEAQVEELFGGLSHDVISILDWSPRDHVHAVDAH